MNTAVLDTTSQAETTSDTIATFASTSAISESTFPVTNATTAMQQDMSLSTTIPTSSVTSQ